MLALPDGSLALARSRNTLSIVSPQARYRSPEDVLPRIPCTSPEQVCKGNKITTPLAMIFNREPLQKGWPFDPQLKFMPHLFPKSATSPLVSAKQPQFRAVAKGCCSPTPNIRDNIDNHGIKKDRLCQLFGRVSHCKVSLKPTTTHGAAYSPAR